MSAEIWLAFLIGVLVGGTVVGLICAAAETDAEKEVEKSGVWKIKDRAYKLTRINP